MQILFLVLKVIGILLLSILGILLFLLLMVLFAPIRYRINGEIYEKIKATLTFRWLFPVLYGKAEYKEEAFNFYIKLFWIKIYPREEKEGKKAAEEKEAELVTMERSIKSEIQKTIEEDYSEGQKSTEKSQWEGQNTSEEDNLYVKKKESIMKHFILKIKSFFQKIKDVWISTKENITHFWKNMKIINDKKRILIAFIKTVENKAGFLRILSSFKGLLKHIKPGRIKGEVEVGLNDPAATGQLLGGLALFYGVFGEQVKIIPNFQESVLKGTILLKGRIRVFTLLLICIKLLLDNDFKQLKHNFDKIKEELK